MRSTIRNAGSVSACLYGLLCCSAIMAEADEARNAGVIPVQAFAQLQKFQGMQLSPDGQYLAYMFPVDGRRTLMIEHAKGVNKPVVIPPIGEFDLTRFRWLNTTRLLVEYEMTRQGGRADTKETRLLAVNHDGSNPINPIEAERVRGSGARSTIQGQMQSRVVDWLPEDSDHILVAQDPDRDGSSEVWRVNINNKDHTVVQKQRTGAVHYLADHSGTIRLAFALRGRTQVFLDYLDPHSNTWRGLANSKWFQRGIRPVALTADPGVAYAIGPISSDRNALVTLDLISGEIKNVVFSRDDVEVDRPIFDSTGRKLVGVAYTDDFRRSYHIDSYYKMIQEFIDSELADNVNLIVQHVPEIELFLVYSYSDRNPGHYMVLDLRAKRFYYLTETMRGLETEDMSFVTAKVYTARDGLKIPAYLTVPKGRDPAMLPVVILPHGGPHARDTQAFHFVAQFLASRGYGVLQPNFRGSSGFGLDFERKGHEQWGGKMQDDLTDAVSWLVNEGIADPERICIVGMSYGGYAALMGAVKTPDLYACAASINGVPDLPAMVRHDKKFHGGSIWTKSIGLEGSRLKEISPYHRLKEIKIPVLLVAAHDDARVPYEQSRRLYKKLKGRVPSTYLELSNGGHGLDTEQARIQTLTALQDFLAEHLYPRAGL